MPFSWVCTWQWVRPRPSMPLACWHKRVSSWSWWMSMRCWFSTTKIWRQDTRKCAKPTLSWRTASLWTWGWLWLASWLKLLWPCWHMWEGWKMRWNLLKPPGACLIGNCRPFKGSGWTCLVRLVAPNNFWEEGKDSGKWVWGRWRAAIYTGAARERDARDTWQAFGMPAGRCLGCVPCAS